MLKYIYNLDKEGKIDEALDYLYDYVDDLLYQNEIKIFWDDLETVKLEDFSHCLLVGILTTTLPVKNDFQRKPFVKKIRNIIQDDESLEGLF